MVGKITKNCLKQASYNLNKSKIVRHTEVKESTFPLNFAMTKDYKRVKTIFTRLLYIPSVFNRLILSFQS